ncbi:hypothetical protein HQ571_02420 [Candidatus Kuenenbacteria bacterium]|nr:hypothetical protein [Candidatus Kuenenbacteria bacterium]
MELSSILKSIGFDSKQSAVYLACLQLGEDSVFNIAKLANVKRPTTYVILNSLAERGLISLRKTNKATLYSAASPKKLLDQIKQRQKNLESAIPNLMAIYNQQPNKPEVQFFEGKDGIAQVYYEVLEVMRSGLEVVFYGSIIEPVEIYPDLFEEYKETLKNLKVKTREILPWNEENIKYAKIVSKFKNPNHGLRFFNKKYECGRGDNIIFGNKIAFLPYHKNKYYVIVIENEDLVITHKTLFEHAWKAAKPLKQ